MIRKRLMAALRLVILLGILATAWLTLRSMGGAQPLPSTAEALARVCVAEAGWETSTGDCAAIVHLLVRRAERRELSTRRMAALYSSRHFDRERTDARRWIVGLDARAERPAGWPARLPWPRYREDWLAALEHVRAALRGDVADPCRGEADHWGAPYGGDLERATAAGWVRLDCGETRNAFWRVP